DGSDIVQLTHHPKINSGDVRNAMISGSGNRVVYSANSNPLGTNPSRMPQLFVVDTATLDVTQLTTAGEIDWPEFSIDDAGDRIAFTHADDLAGSATSANDRVFTIFADGTGLTEVETTLQRIYWPWVSGNGQKFVYGTSQETIHIHDWGGATPITRFGEDARITDDGRFVYYDQYLWGPPGIQTSVLRYDTQLLVETQVTSTRSALSLVSGANTRLGYVADENGLRFVTEDLAGGDETEILLPASNPTDLTWANSVDISADGSRVMVVRDTDENPDERSFGDVWLVEPSGGGMTRITQDAWPGFAGMSHDGQNIVLGAHTNLLDPSDTSFANRIYRLRSDGSDLIDLSHPNSAGWDYHPDIAGTDHVVFFSSGIDFAPDAGVFTVSADGGPIGETFFEENLSDAGREPRISADGAWVVYQTGANATGQNPDFGSEVVRVSADGNTIEQLSMDPTYGSHNPDISSDGRAVAYVSYSNPLGTNPDHNAEIFFHDVDTQSTTQLTHTATGESLFPRISGDGRVVYFFSSAEWLGPAGAASDVYRVDVGTGIVRRASGLLDRDHRSQPAAQAYGPALAVDHDGSHAVFSAAADSTGTIPNNGSIQLHVVDFTAPGRVSPGPDAPTVVTWDAEPSPVSYDVIRGRVDNLALSGDKQTVDLGAVVCLEDDSPDATTEGFGDVPQPLPGEVFFFVHRGHGGIGTDPGSWGRGSGGLERVAGPGSCGP
ncbi:MAG: hypothetical protein GY716_06120, partial [bacterium]|nr:hypothetical protein [bacterium]